MTDDENLPIKIDQSPVRMKDMVGYSETENKLVRLYFKCMRKPDLTYKQKNYFCFMSHPSFTQHSSMLSPFMMLHCLRNDKILHVDCPKYLFPESDFVDPIFFPTVNSDIRYDYVYFTINKPGAGLRYKGVDTFFESVPILNQMGLRGCVVVYYGGRSSFFYKSRAYKSFKKHLKWCRKPLNSLQVATYIARSRFVFFPNYADCSPRMIPESFLQNKPVVLNSKIWGGYHYIDKHNDFGRTFIPKNKKSLINAVQEVLKLPNKQRDIWLNNYGFESSSRKLANLIREHYKLPNQVSHVYFKDYKEVFKFWKECGGVNDVSGDRYYSNLFPYGPFNI